MTFIKVHLLAKPPELLLLNVSDIEYAYQNPEDESGAVIGYTAWEKKRSVFRRSPTRMQPCLRLPSLK
jgi:hypothetical protein